MNTYSSNGYLPDSNCRVIHGKQSLLFHKIGLQQQTRNRHQKLDRFRSFGIKNTREVHYAGY
jgi:hypothetical protein